MRNDVFFNQYTGDLEEKIREINPMIEYVNLCKF